MAIVLNQPEKLIRVIKCYSNDIVENALSKVSSEMSRTDSREFDSCKTIDRRLEFVLKRPLHRSKFFSYLYILSYGDCPVCNYESPLEISDSCNVDNHLERIAYFLLCCSNDPKYFAKNITTFLSSSVVNKALSNLWEEPTPISQGDSTCGTLKSSANNTLEETNMSTYFIGYIKKRNTFYNFYPIAKYDENGLVSIGYDDLIELFPKHGGINLRTDSIYNNNSYNYISDLDGIVDSYVNESRMFPMLFAVRFSIDELTDNDDDDIQLRLDIDSIVHSGVRVEDIIFSAEKLNIFRVVGTDTPNPNLVEGAIQIYNECDNGENVLLYSGSKIYGPFKTQYNRNYEMTIAPNVRIAKTPFVVDYWESKELNIQETSISIFRTEFCARIALAVPDRKKQEDLITEPDLIESVAKIIIDSDYDPKKFLRMLLSESPLFASSLSSDVLNNRKSLALKLFEVEESRKQILERFNATVTQNDIAEVFQDRVVFPEKYSKSQSDLETLKKKNDEMSARIAEYEKREHESHYATPKDNQEYDELRQKYDSLQAEYNCLKDRINSLDSLEKEIGKLENRKDTREEDAQKANEKAKKAEGDAKKAVSAMHSKLDSVMNELREQVSAAFDPVVSSALLEAASRFDSDNEQSEIKEKVAKTNLINKSDAVFIGSGDELLSYIVTNIQKYRKYSFNQIVNILICCTQNFLTVFSGEPGIGKTSICNIIANSLGLNLFEDYSAPSRYVAVSVEKGWATKRDLIGYYNPLTHKYDKSNSSVYNGLMLLDKEAEDSAYPFFILLDEANLSQMEYYWADFMNVADRTTEICKINIGMENDLVIPKTLRFLATINNDETTIELSPRLIDRAWIIHLPSNSEIVTDIPESYKSIFNKIVTWKSLCEIFESKPNQVVDDDSKNILNSIYKVFNKFKYTISPRIKTSIERYLIIANSIMEDETGVAKNKIAIDYAVTQKLLPKISGIYDERIESILGELKELSDQKNGYNLSMTKKLIEEAMYRHQYEMDMGYCSFMN